MEVAVIRGETRQPGGRHHNERLRRRGLVPAVIYGHGQAPETVALSLHDTLLALQHVAHVISLRIDGHEQQYLIKDVQFDHLQQTPIHVDLMRVSRDERVQVRVPVELRGTPRGVHEGGTLVHVLPELEVECLLLEIPEAIRAHVEHLGLNEMLHVREIPLPASVKVLHRPDDIVAIVHPPRGITAAETEEAAAAAAAASAEPEVIGRGPREQAEAEGERKE